MDAAARPGRQPLILETVVPETVYGSIDMGFRSLIMEMAIGGGLGPGVPNAIIPAFDAAVSHLGEEARIARWQEAEARGQLQTTLSLVSECMKALGEHN